MSTTLAVETRRLTKIYGSGRTEVVAMRDVSITVNRGEVVALLGPSGSGKSTFLTAVGLINPPSSGEIRINGTLVQNGPHAAVNITAFRRNNIGFVFQKANLIPFLSARENIQVALDLAGWPMRKARDRATKLMETLGVAERADNMPSDLSGGEQQRVAIARALANEPSVILADEPTAALDKERGRQVMELFREVVREHATGVIVVTHDERALDVFDTLYDMEDGVIQPRLMSAASKGVPA
jgi:putative ABC transport system ATP-binding protein